MTAPRIRIAPARVSLTPDEAAASLGVGRTTFDTAIRPDLKLIRVGRTVLVPVAELERWALENAEATIEVAS
jgi:excisionase family DNA binding protein